MNRNIKQKRIRYLCILAVVIAFALACVTFLNSCLSVAKPAFAATPRPPGLIAQSPDVLQPSAPSPSSVIPSPVLSPAAQPTERPIQLPGDPPPVPPEQAKTVRERIADSIAAEAMSSKFGAFNLFIIFFVTLGPLKVIPVFVQLTTHADRILRRQLALRSTFISTIVIMLVSIIGQNMVRIWRIELPALLITGGILLFVVAFNIVMTQYAPPTKVEEPPLKPSLDLAIAPLSFPTILPPFGIAIALTIMVTVRQLNLNQISVLGLLLLVMGLNLVCMLAARPILKFLKPTLLRILGFALGVMQLALGIEFILGGIELQVLVLQKMMTS